MATMRKNHNVTAAAAAALAYFPGEELVLNRAFDVPPHIVYRAWTELEHLKSWWGPAGFLWVRGNIELRPGGHFHYCLRSANGEAMWGKFRYFVIDPPRRLVFTTSFSNERLKTVRAPFSSSWPLEVLITLELRSRDGGSILTLRGVPYNASEEEHRSFAEWRDAMERGFAGTLEQLEGYLGRVVRVLAGQRY